MGTKPSRLRAMPYSPMFPGQKGRAFSAAESTKEHLQMGSRSPWGEGEFKARLAKSPLGSRRD